MKIERPPIPWEKIRDAGRQTETPAKKLGVRTARVYEAVATLKAARASGVSDQFSKYKLEDLFEELVDSYITGDFTAFDEFAKAWTKLDVTPHVIRHEEFGTSVVSIQGNTPRARIGSVLVTAVDMLQTVHKRAPTRAEILDFLSTHPAMESFGGNIALDDSELCRQLRKLDWQDLLSE